MPVFLIIGSNSFSGSSFISYLLSQGYKVLGVSRSRQINKVFLPFKWIQEEKDFKFSAHDVNSQYIGSEKIREKPSLIVTYK